MIAGLILGAIALLVWPRRTRWSRHTPDASAAKRGGKRLDAFVPQVLGAAVALLIALVTQSLPGAATGVGIGVLTAIWLRRSRRQASTNSGIDRSLPLALTVAALLLRAGRPPSDALARAARCCNSDSVDEIEVVDRRVTMGESFGVAWSSLLVHRHLGAAARAAMRASTSGAALAGAWESTADRIRSEQRVAAEVSARKVGVHALAPLGLCFLPAFICLGVVPIVIGLASDIL